MPETILIVEDQPADAELLEIALRDIGVINPIHIVKSGLEAIRYLEGVAQYSDRNVYPFPKIILLDLKMPEMDGFDFLKWAQLKYGWGLFHVFVITGLEDLTAIRRAYNSGARSFIAKPADRSDLQNLIATHPEYWARNKSEKLCGAAMSGPAE